jgi:predicted RNase H-like HicB family nuclease
MHYPVVIHKDPDSDYGVTVPDVLGCFSAGETIEEALVYVCEAIECHIEGLLISEDEIPLPTSIENHLKNPDYSDGLWAIVDIDLTKLSGDVRRINVTMPERILNKLDRYVMARGATRSGILAAAALDYMVTHPTS